MKTLEERLTIARAEVSKLELALTKALQNEERQQRRRNRQEFEMAQKWTERVRARLIDEELKVATLEVDIEARKPLKNGMVRALNGTKVHR